MSHLCVEGGEGEARVMQVGMWGGRSSNWGRAEERRQGEQEKGMGNKDDI